VVLGSCGFEDFEKKKEVNGLKMGRLKAVPIFKSFYYYYYYFI
jgi:hypothetical protein